MRFRNVVSKIIIIALVLTMLPTGTVFAADITSEITNASLLACVRTALTISEPTPITDNDAAALTSLDCSGLGITSAAGIEYFTGLTSLDLNGNQLTTINLSTNTALEILDLGANNLSTIDLSLNTALTDLTLYQQGNLTAISLSTNTALTSVNLANNFLTTIDVSDNTALTSLALQGNDLTTIDVLLNTSLSYLDISGNNITDISSLVANAGITGSGDTIDVRNNPLNLTSFADIGTLSGRGVNVTYNTYCGNNNVEYWNDWSEQCDDGNNTSGDGCSDTCQNEGGGMPPEWNVDGADDHEIIVNVSFPEWTQYPILVAGWYGDATDGAPDGYVAISSPGTAHIYVPHVEGQTTVMISALWWNSPTIGGNPARMGSYATPISIAGNGPDTIDVTLNETGGSGSNLTDAWVDDEAGSTTFYALFDGNSIPGGDLSSYITIQNRAGTVLSAFLQSNPIEYNGTTYTDQVVVGTYSETVVPGDVLLVDGQPDTGIVYYGGAGPTDIVFADANFEACVRGNFGIDEFTAVTDVDAETLTSLSCGEMGITDATGIEYFTNLTYLYMGANSLTTIDLSANTALEELNLAFNSLTTIDLSANTALESLFLDSNNLTSIDVSANTSLINLYLSNNALTTIDVSANTVLYFLFLNGNDLTSVNLSGATALNHLWLDSNALTTVDVSENTALTELWLQNNTLTAIDVSDNTALTELNLQNNALTTINVGENTALTDLNISDNTLTTIDVSANTVLYSLSLYSNNLTSINVSGATALRYLYLNDNAFTSIDVSGATTLTTLVLNDNALTSITAGAALTTLYLESNNLTDASIVSGLTSLNNLTLANNSITDISDLSGLTSLESLALNNNSISDIEPLLGNAGIGSNDYVDFSGNPLDSVLADLYILAGRGVFVTYDWVCSNELVEWPETCDDGNNTDWDGCSATCQIEGCTDGSADNFDPSAVVDNGTCLFPDPPEDIWGCTDSGAENWDPSANMDDASCTYPPTPVEITFTDANLEACVRTALEIPTDPITDEDALTLESLDCSPPDDSTPEFPITDLTGLEYFTNLTGLDLGYNSISDLGPLSGLTNLTSLNLFYNYSIGDISDLSGLTSLTSLDIGDNSISDLSPLSGLTSLTYLVASGNYIADWDPLSDLTSLTYLDLQASQISDLGPLSSLTSLTQLNLYNDGVSDLTPLIGLTSLGYLELGRNYVSDVGPLVDNVGFGAGDNISLTNNPLNLASLVDIGILGSRDVYVGYDWVCGNSVIDVEEDESVGFETCDDGNNDDGDGCSAICQIEEGGGDPDPVEITFVDENFEACVRDALDIPTDPITENDAAALTDLNCSNSGITSTAGLEYFTGLTSLNLESNALTTLDVSANTALTYLHLEFNSLASLDVSQNTDLIYLDLYGNALTSIDVSANTALDYLTLSANALTEIDVSQNTALSALWLNYNDLTEIDVSHNTALQHLSLFHNELTSIDVSANTALDYLDLSNNALTEIDVSNNTALDTLVLNSSNLTTIDVSVNTDLRELYLNNNNITDIGSLVANAGITGSGDFVYLNGNSFNLTSLADINTLIARDVHVNYDQVCGDEVVQEPETCDDGNNTNGDDCSAICQVEVEIEFADANLEACVRTALEIPTDPIMDTTVLGRTTLSCNGRSISDLTGLEYFVDLDTLDLSNNTITDVSPLSGLTTLVDLYLDGNSISNADALSGLTSLYNLSLYDNSISSIGDWSGLNSLHYLNVRNNSISDISNLASLTTLTELGIGYNSISNISVLSGLTDLTNLEASNNSIIDVHPLSGLHLTTLHLNNNSIVSVYPLSAMTSLTFLNLSDNFINSTNDFRWLFNLTYLNLGDNAIRNVSSLEWLTNLNTLQLPNNLISDITPLVSNAGIGTGDTVTLIGNSLNLASVAHVGTLVGRGATVPYNYVCGNSAVEGTETCDDGNNTSGDGCSSTCQTEVEITFADANFEACVRDALEIASPTPITNSDAVTLTSLSCSTAEINSADEIEYFTDLDTLELGWNNLTSIDVSHNTALTDLELYDNHLTSIDVSANTALTDLNIGWNDLTSVDLSHNTALRYFDASGNTLTTIDVSANTSLLSLNLEYNTLTSIDVSANTALTYLELGINNLTSIDVSTNTNLDTLDLEENYLSTIDLSNNSVLRYLRLKENDLTTIDLSGGIALENLDLRDNDLTAIDVSTNTALTSLTLNGNSISDISSLGELMSLHTLFLDGNSITDIQPLVDNAGLGSGDGVGLSYNPLSDESINVLIPELEGRGVTVFYEVYGSPWEVPTGDDHEIILNVNWSEWVKGPISVMFYYGTAWGNGQPSGMATMGSPGTIHLYVPHVPGQEFVTPIAFWQGAHDSNLMGLTDPVSILDNGPTTVDINMGEYFTSTLVSGNSDNEIEARFFTDLPNDQETIDAFQNVNLWTVEGVSPLSVVIDGVRTIHFVFENDIVAGAILVMDDHVGGILSSTIQAGEIPDPILGCTNPDAENYDPSADTDDGSCTFAPILGCTSPDAENYDPSADTDDGSCTYAPILGCTNPDAENYDPSADTDDGSCTFAPGPVEVVFADPNLEACARTILGIPEPTPITSTDAQSISAYFTCHNSVTDLTGMEYFTNLVNMDFNGNSISDLSPLAELTALTELHIVSNSITDISVLSGLPNLARLQIGNNLITDISPLAGLTHLYELNLSNCSPDETNNLISDISPLSGLTSLTNLGLCGVSVTDISPLAGLTSLLELELRANNISDITPLASLTDLRTLQLGGNQISNITPLAGLTHLTSLDIGQNSISNIGALSNLTSLTSLTLGWNSIVDISPLSGLTSLTNLQLNTNSIVNIGVLAGLTHLSNLTLDCNPLDAGSIALIGTLTGQGVTVDYDESLTGCGGGGDGGGDGGDDSADFSVPTGDDHVFTINLDWDDWAGNPIGILFTYGDVSSDGNSLDGFIEVAEPGTYTAYVPHVEGETNVSISLFSQSDPGLDGPDIVWFYGTSPSISGAGPTTLNLDMDTSSYMLGLFSAALVRGNSDTDVDVTLLDFSDSDFQDQEMIDFFETESLWSVGGVSPISATLEAPILHLVFDQPVSSDSTLLWDLSDPFEVEGVYAGAVIQGSDDHEFIINLDWDGWAGNPIGIQFNYGVISPNGDSSDVFIEVAEPGTYTVYVPHLEGETNVSISLFSQSDPGLDGPDIVWFYGESPEISGSGPTTLNFDMDDPSYMLGRFSAALVEGNSDTNVDVTLIDFKEEDFQDQRMIDWLETESIWAVDGVSPISAALEAPIIHLVFAQPVSSDSTLLWDLSDRFEIEGVYAGAVIQGSDAHEFTINLDWEGWTGAPITIGFAYGNASAPDAKDLNGFIEIAEPGTYTMYVPHVEGETNITIQSVSWSSLDLFNADEYADVVWFYNSAPEISGPGPTTINMDMDVPSYMIGVMSAGLVDGNSDENVDVTLLLFSDEDLQDQGMIDFFETESSWLVDDVSPVSAVLEGDIVHLIFDQAVNSDSTILLDLSSLVEAPLFAEAVIQGDGSIAFTDASLETCVRSALGGDFWADQDTPITEDDALDLTMLTCESDSISDLTGLEYFTNLTYLDLLDNSISDLSPLSGLDSLTNLNLGWNSISNIGPLSNLDSLAYLTIHANSISDISPLSGMTALEGLYIGANSISDISVLSGLTALRYAYLYSNSISDIEPLVQNAGLTDGDSIYLSGNPLSDESFTFIATLMERGVNVDYDVPTCTSFTYSDWSTCVDKTKTRTVSTSSPEGCTGGTPVLESTCGGGGLIITDVDPPVIDPPIVDPPIVIPPIVIPPVVDPPIVIPPVVDPPIVIPPVVDPPIVVPPVIDPPIVDPPVEPPAVIDPSIVIPPPSPYIPNFTVNDIVEIYHSGSYGNIFLKLVVDDKKDCLGDKAMNCLEKIYGVTQSQESEIGDAVVFGKQPGEIITTPRLVNLKGIVGSNPVILAVSAPNDKLFVRINTVPMMTIQGYSDAEGKAVMGLTQPLRSGDYSAEIYAVRKGVAVLGNKTNFTVDQQVDNEFYISNMVVTEEDAHAPYAGEPGEFVAFILSYVEKFEPKFIALDYIEFTKTGGKVYVVTGNVDQTQGSENAIVYLAFKSVTFGSAVISDAGQKGAFRMVVPKGLGASSHTLTAYAFNPKTNVSTSAKKAAFVIKK